MSNETSTVKHMTPPVLIRVSGNHREMGRQMGAQAAAQVKHSIEDARNLLASTYDSLQLTWAGAEIQARKYLPFAQERYPKIVEELQGIAEGADVPFDDLAVLNAMEAVTMDALHLTKCTSLGVNEQRTANGHILIGHNEDWVPEDEPDMFIIHATPDDEPTFLAMTYGGLLPNIGFNSAGIAQCCDSVYPSDCRIGIPRVILSRAVLAAKTPAEAIRHMLAPLRAAGYNHLLEQTGQHTTQTMQAILRDHVNYPDSICNHATEDDDPLTREKTITSLLMDLTARQMHVAWGNPCENNYHTYQMDE
jgi:isopenicillin-N N-acyltransferase-like protein